MTQLPSSDPDNQAKRPANIFSLEDWLVLSFLPGIGCTTAALLVSIFGSPGQVLLARPAELLAVESVGRKLTDSLTDPVLIRAARQKAEAAIAEAAASDYGILCLDDSLYPAGLLNIPDAPVILYCRGRLECLEKPAIALVGSRASTTYGKRVSFELARELARNGVCVVSGMAMGIDGEAHAGALAGGGLTVGVLGCGLDVVYPPQNAKLFEEVASQGLLLSEYPPGTAPDGFRFPERNRIISGIALGTVVVEASLKSGSLITAKLALEQGRDVFAVPGRIDSPKSRGAHLLLQEGAKLVTCVDDILEELDLAGVLDLNSVGTSSDGSALELQAEEKHLLSCLEVYPVTIDDLVRGSGYDTATVFQMLLRLELMGVVRQLPGQQYERLLPLNV